jgi:hypothetical protein
MNLKQYYKWLNNRTPKELYNRKCQKLIARCDKIKLEQDHPFNFLKWCSAVYHTFINHITLIFKFDKDYIGADARINVLGVLMSIAVIVAGIGFVVNTAYTPGVWSTSNIGPDGEELDQPDINQRIKKRGLIASSLSTCIFVFINIFMTSMGKCDRATYQALVSMITAGMVGFILDNIFATEEGCNMLNQDDNKGLELSNFPKTLKYALGTLYSPKFPRYIITIALDIFISLVLTDGLSEMITSLFYTPAMSSIVNITSMAIVGFTTFLTYANATRLEWAYPDTAKATRTSDFIPSSTILIGTVVAGMVFLIWNRKDECGLPPRGITSKTGKLTSIILTLLVISFTYQMGWLDPKPDQEVIFEIITKPDQEEKTVNTKVLPNPNIEVQEKDDWQAGLGIFMAFSIVMLIITFGQTNLDVKNNKKQFVGSIILTCFFLYSPLFALLKLV